jgi:ABC-type spermidine/putrescine transport system permease subunit II
MNLIGICVSVVAVVVAVLLFYRMRRLRPEMAGYASQRMCPACGLITPRAKTACMECGKVFLGPVK